MSTTTARTSRFVDTLGVIAVVTGLVLGLVPGIALPAADASHGSGPLGSSDFELDGNITGTHDWSGLGGEQLPPDGTAKAKNELNWFKASTKESDYPNWTFIQDGNADKSDLHRLFIKSQVAGADSYLWLGASRVSDNGNTQVTVEFNQNDTTDLTQAYRTPGDFWIRFNFPGKPTGQNGVDQVTVAVAVWTGTPSTGAYPAPTTLPASAFKYAIGGVGAGAATDFIELQLDLNYIFGQGGLGLECAQFGGANFRTESSGGSDNNNDPTLKDVAGPYPIDLDTCANVTVEKVDEEGNPLNGATFSAYSGHDAPATGTPAATCITGPDATDEGGADSEDDGECSFGQMLPGPYTLHETGVPAGYVASPDLPVNFTVVQNTPLALGPYTDPRIPYTITVEPDGRNAVGNDHTFEVTLSDDDGGVAGETIDLSWSGVGDGIIQVVDDAGTTNHDPAVGATTCVTDADGTCDVTVTSDAAGDGDLTATWDTPYQNATVSAPGNTTYVDGGPATAPYTDISDSANKIWVGYVAKIEADATNLVGDAHTFTATVWEVDGQGTPDGVLADDVTVTVTWDGPTGSTIDSTTCVTGSGSNSTGTCTFEVNSPTASGPGTITITQLDGTIAGIGGQADEALSDTTPTAADGGSLSAVKTWREYRASIDDDSINPAGQTHTFTVTVEYSDDGGSTWQNPGAGLTVAWDGPTNGSNVLADSTCDDGTDSDGQCTIVVYNDAPGVGTVTVTAVDGDLLLDGGASADGPYDVADVAATKTWLAFAVDISDPAVNLVGESHTFRVEVSYSDGGDYEPVAAGTKVAWTDSSDSRVTADSCSTGTGDDPDTGAVETNICFVTVNSSTTGTFEITVTGVDDFQFTGRTEDVDFNTPGESSKTWVDYRAYIAADGVNLVGDDHTFTVTAQVDDGTGWAAVEDGTVVTVTASGLAASVDQSDCADGTTGGTCQVVVDSDAPGTVTITVDTVGNATAVDSSVASVDVDGGENLEEGQSVSADKTWIAYRADIQASETNLTGQQHVFTVTAEQNDGGGWTDVPDGTTVGFSTDNDSTVTDDTCDSTSDGECTITVDSSSVDAVTVTIDSVSAEDVDGAPNATVANTALSAAPGGQLSATKTWIEVLVTVEADETNVVGENHTFTIDVDLVTPSGPAEPVSGTVVATTSGVGSEVDQSCDDGLDADGTCTVEVTSTAPGDRVVTAETLTFTYDGKTFTGVDLDGAVGIASGTDLTATKTWRDYRVNIEAHDLNRVRESHTFTVTIEQTDDGSTWADVPDGTTATVGISGTAGSITGGTCETTGTVDGQCTVVVDSTTAGTGTVTVSAISVDLPEEDRTDIAFDVTNDSAAKTWAAFRALISSDSVNVTGDSHDFTLTGQYTVDGSTWLAVPDGSSIGFSDSGVGSTTGDTCDSTVGGDCTVTVTSTTSGDRIVEVTGIDPAAITIAGPDGDIVRDFGLVTLADGAIGIASGTDTDVSATKTWASYTLQLEPATATNLLSGQAGDPERFHTITATLSSDDPVNAPVGDQTIDVSISGDTGVIDSVEDGSVATDGLTATCVTDTDGTCDIVIFSGTPGQATLSASYEATVGESAPVTVDGNDAVKTWTTFRVTVTPESAVNLVGNPHVFTVTVEQSNTDGAWVPVVGTVPTIEVTGTDLTVDKSDCDAGTDADGKCTVTVTSSTVQAVTLTATHTESYDDYDSEVQGQSTVGFSDSGDKDWIDYAIEVTPDTDENLVNTDHVFTVTVTTTFPSEGGTTTAPVVGGDVTVQLDGLGSITDNDCAEGTDTNGQCTVTISSSAAGGSSLTATYMGTATDDEEVRPYSDTALKDWVDYELVISDDAVNAVGDEHTFTATLTIDTGEGFGPAAGETLTFTVDGVGTVTGGDVDEALECTTDASGQCDIVINSDEAGATNVGVSYDAVVGATSRTDTDDAVKQWVDIELVKTAVTGDGFSDGDLIADPGGFPFLAFTSSDQGPKTAVFEYEIHNPSNVTLENVVLTDDRLGTIDLADFPACQTLDPGETCTARASEQFDYSDATASLASLITNVGTVTATGGGEEVSDFDDATITLVAVQSSILIDLVKDVVAGAGDVEVVDGRPIVSWSEAEYDAGVSKTVRYRFTVTNISNSPIIDVELVDPMISAEPIIAKADGVTLQPDESTVVEVDHLLTVDEAFPDGPVASKIDNVATVSGANETRDSFSQDTDDASVFSEIVFSKVLEKEDSEPAPAVEAEVEDLPVTGLDADRLVPLALLLVLMGAAILWLDRRWVGNR